MPFTEVICGLGASPPRTATSPPRTTTSPPRTATSPPANGGNCTTRGATRRRHAVARLLMLQNPHPAMGAEGSQGRTASRSCPHHRPSGPSSPCQPFFIEVVCTLGASPPRTATSPPRTATSPPRTATSPPANGGNCTTRGATRRRHAVARLLMLQNPHPAMGAEGSQGRTASRSCPHHRPSGPSSPCQPFFIEVVCTLGASPTSSTNVPVKR